MSNTARIRDLQSLKALQISINNFCSGAQGALRTIDGDVNFQLQQMMAVGQQVEQAFKDAQQEFERTQRELSSCQAQKTQDKDGNEIRPNCSSQQDQVNNAHRQLEKTRQNYEIYKTQIAKVQFAILNYQNARSIFSMRLSFNQSAGVNSLKQLINGAENYLSVSFTGTSTNEKVIETDAGPSPHYAARSLRDEDIVLEKYFKFRGESGMAYELLNMSAKGMVKTELHLNETNSLCSTLEFERKENSNRGKIVNIKIPADLSNEKVGRHLVMNMEHICRLNDCSEIFGWANQSNIEFYRILGYDLRNHVTGVGAEVFKQITK